jgi:hypothetical protein
VFRRAFKRSSPRAVSVTKSFVSTAVHRTLTIHVGLAISIVVLRRDHGVDHDRADLDARIHMPIGWTLLRHFRLAGPVARLPSGVLSSTAARPLVAGVAAPLALAPRALRARRAAVLMPAVAATADRRQPIAAPTVEQAGTLGLVRTAGDGGLQRTAENWTSSPRPGITLSTRLHAAHFCGRLEGRD